MIQEQVSDQQYEDGLALLRLVDKHPEAWDAIERLAERLSNDLIHQWSSDDSGKYTKKWLRGAREANDALVPALRAMMDATRDSISERKDLEVAGKLPAEDGQGTGDLALV